MNLPFFYITESPAVSSLLTLSEDNSKHIVQVLRMQEAELLRLTDGKGNIYDATIISAHKKHCEVKITGSQFAERSPVKVCIAVSPVKNNSRFEWFLEKATEIGVHEIVPLICKRTEKQHLRFDRLNGILISAMLQSQQAWLPVLHEGIKFEKFTEDLKNDASQKFIAHCDDQQKFSLREELNQATDQPISQRTILIGPEGDFTKEEIELALQNNFKPVTLGSTRLRTETAALTAAVLLCVS